MNKFCDHHVRTCARGSNAHFSLRSVPGGLAGRGFSLLEIIFAIGLFLVFVAGVTYLLTGDFRPFVGGGNSADMMEYAQEAMEVLEVIQERSWKHISENATGASMLIRKDGSGNWELAPGTETRGAFTRSIVLSVVSRDSSGNIAASGDDDPATKQVAITISASGRADYVLRGYLSNWNSYRMFQTAWSGSSGVTAWAQGSTDYLSHSQMDLPTTSLQLMLGYQ